MEDKIWNSAITCPNIVHDGLASLMVLITHNESPSTTIWWIQSSLAKLMALLAVKASTISTDPGCLTFLKALIICPSESLMTTPKPDPQTMLHQNWFYKGHKRVASIEYPHYEQPPGEPSYAHPETPLTAPKPN